jgi:hypothetical protein
LAIAAGTGSKKAKNNGNNEEETFYNKEGRINICV